MTKITLFAEGIAVLGKENIRKIIGAPAMSSIARAMAAAKKRTKHKFCGLRGFR